MKNKILAIALFAGMSLGVNAQSADNITGRILDKKGNPIAGALVSVEGNPFLKTATNNNGVFEISAEKHNVLQIVTPQEARKNIVVTETLTPIVIVMDPSSEKVNYGFTFTPTFGESTGAVSTVASDEISKRSSQSVGNSLYGNVVGLTTLQKTGSAWDQMPSMFIRGQKTLNGNNGILVVVDGLERDNAYQVLNYITPEEIESVAVLRDAAAIALYGFKGVNGVLNIVTKRGTYKSRQINFSYDHAFTSMKNIPDLADSYTYANALNQALVNDGKPKRYNQHELDAFQSGKYPHYYPNVNWWDETMRENASTDIATLSFSGGSLKMRYFTMLNLQYDKGFIKNANMNEGYSTQEKFSKGNFRTNLDVELTRTTTMQANIMGVLSEYSRPGLGSDNLMYKLYTLPSAAFPVKTENGLWGGNATWDGYYNPVALTQGRAYSKSHSRALYADLSLRQDLSTITKGLGATLRMGYDNIATYWENHTKDYRFGSTSVTSWKDGVPHDLSSYTGGTDTEMKGGSKLDWQYRSMNFQATLDWTRQFGDNNIYTAVMYSYKYDNNLNTSLYNCNLSWFTNYTFKKRYIIDFTLMNSASNILEKGDKWHMSPIVGLAWVMSRENFMKDSKWINFMKLRGSAGIINTDNIPYNGYWYESVNGGGSGYPIQDNFGNGGAWQEGALPSRNGTTEKAYKYNLGLEGNFFNALNMSVDGFYEQRKDIWVNTYGQNSAVLGASSSYANKGHVDSWGVEVSADYYKTIGKVTLNIGGNFTWNRNKIKNMMEEPMAYDYLSKTGKALGQVTGYQALGFFIDQADIDNSPIQQFGTVKPGDIKYKDINGDNVINEFDRIPMGYSSQIPEIYYGFTLGVEWKGIGVNATFQGAGNYTANLNSSYFNPLVGNTTISNYYAANCWKPENPNARFPRLSTETIQNNDRVSSVWLADRSFLKLRHCEVYYRFPKALLNPCRMKSARLYARGVDLFSWDHIKGFDPEAIGDVYPATRSVHIGLAVEF